MDKLNKGDYISLNQAASIYGYTRDHLGYLIRNGDLKGEKLGSFYFTKDEWIRNYIKSGKARKQEMRIRQRAKKAKRPELRIKNHELRDGSKRFLIELRKEIAPLIKDLWSAAKGFGRALKGVGSGVKKSYGKMQILESDFIKELEAWQREILYFKKRLTRIISQSEMINKIINMLRKNIEFAIWKNPLTLIKFNKYYAIVKAKYRAKLVNLLKKQEREIIWRLSHQSRLPHIKKSRNIKLNRKAIALSVLCLGLIISGTGLYPVLSKIDFSKSALIGILDKASTPVYLYLEDNYQFQKLLSFSSETTNILRQTSKKFSYDNFKARLTRNSDERKQQIAKYLSVVSEITDNNFKEFLLQAKLRTSIIDNNLSGIRLKAEKLANIFIYALNNIDITNIKNTVAKKINNAFISFETKSHEGIGSIKEVFQEMGSIISRKTAHIKNRLYVWQSANNRELAQIDNKLTQIKNVALANMNRGAQEQLAQLKVNFDFIVKPLSKFRNSIGNLFHHNDQRIAVLEKKIEQLEDQTQSPASILNAEPTREGLIVIPSIGNMEEQKKEIQEAFSDEVAIEPDETGRSGIIKPIFKKATDQEYLYLLVPIAETGVNRE